MLWQIQGIHNYNRDKHHNWSNTKQTESTTKMSDAQDRLHLKLAIINEIIVHISTITTKTLVIDVIVCTKYKVLHMDSYTQSANTGTSGQCVATCEHPVQAGWTQTLTTKRKNIYNWPQGKEENIMTVTRDHLSIPESHIPSPLAP